MAAGGGEAVEGAVGGAGDALRLLAERALERVQRRDVPVPVVR